MALAYGPVDPAIFAQLAEIAVDPNTYVLIHVGALAPGGDSIGDISKLASADVAIVRGMVIKLRDAELLDALAGGEES